MKTALEFLLANGLSEKGLNWNQKVYGNAIYLNGKKIVLDGEILELAKRRFYIYINVKDVNVKNNLIYCDSNDIPFTVEDTKNYVKEILTHYKHDLTTEESIEEITETVNARKAEAFNTLVNGINGLLTNEGKKVKFDALCAFIMQ